MEDVSEETKNHAKNQPPNMIHEDFATKLYINGHLLRNLFP